MQQSVKRTLSYIISYGQICAILMLWQYVYADSSLYSPQGFQNSLYQIVGMTSTEISTVAPEKSLMLLGNIFGNVGAVLASGQTTMMGIIFAIFNNAIISIASLSIGYSTMLAVANTAAEGASMGKKMQQTYYFLVFRQVAAVAMAVPQINGYSTIQILMMWVIVQGVYFADVLWIKSAEYVMYAQSFAAQLVSEVSSAQGTISASSYQQQVGYYNQWRSAYNLTQNIVNSTMCATFMPYTSPPNMGALEPLSGYSTIITTPQYDASGGISYTIRYPNNCGTINIANTIVNGVDVTSSVYELVMNSVYTIFNAVSATVPFVNDPLYTQCATNMVAGLGSNNIAQCATYAQSNCSVGFAIIYSSELLSAQLQTISVANAPQVSCDGSDFSLSKLYGVGWMGVATHYYQGVSALSGCGTTPITTTDLLSPNVKFSQNQSNTGVISSNYKYIVPLVMGLPLVASQKMVAINTPYCQAISMPVYPSVQQGQNSTCGGYSGSYPWNNDAFCNAQNVVMQSSLNIVENVWGGPPNRSINPYAMGVVTADSVTPTPNPSLSNQYANFNNAINSETGQSPTWLAIASGFWPLMNTYYVASSNAWITTFLDPMYTTAMVTDPLHTFSQLAIFLVNTSTIYMFAASGEVANDMLGFTFEALALLMEVLISGALADGMIAALQNYGDMELNACWLPGLRLFPMVPFCFIIFILFIPIFINVIIGLIVIGVSTALRIALKVVLDAVAQATLQIVQMSLGYKMRYIALIFYVSVPVLTVASYLAVYIPMLPVIMYSVAVVGWFIAVIEAMIGVPLVVLGMTSVQGHDLLGSAQQTMILMLSVFIRPATLVIGFMFGVINLSLFGLISSVFISPYIAYYISMMQSASIDDTSQAIILAVFMLVYLSVYAIVIQLAFGAMFKIPSMVLRWIGAQGISSGEEEALDQLQSEARQQIGSIAGAFGGLGSGLGKVMGSGMGPLNEAQQSWDFNKKEDRDEK